MFTVAKIRPIQSNLGYKTKQANCSTSVNNEVSNWNLANGNRICKFRKEKPTVEGEKSCYNKTANKNAENCIRHRSRDKLCRRSLGCKNRLVGAITTYSNRPTKSIYRTEQDKFNSMDKSIRKNQKLLQRHPSITSSDDDVEELIGERTLNASTTETISTKSNTILSTPSNFPGETFPTVNPVNTIMSVVPRNCKVVSKATALPELFNLRFIESQYPLDPQIEAVYQLVKSKDPDTASKTDITLNF